ncbi:TPA: arginine--tRNA ligase [Candidatus Woesearchaeota archaeon]|nr:arginine--tRNA ligase [Candidatus Woesearchaeota archaeon]
MMDIGNQLKEAIKIILSKEISLEVPPDQKLGDYALPCFPFAKELKKSPIEIAKELAEKLSVGLKNNKELKTNKELKSLSKLITVQATGPYVNFFVDKSYVAENVIAEVLKNKLKYGSHASKKQKVMVEFVSPNTNKSLHLGHVRNALLGEAVSRVLEFSGYDVVRICLNNDRGTGMSEAMLGHRMFHKDESPKLKNIKPDHFVAQCYVDFKKAEQEDEKLKEKVQSMVLDWENEKPEVISLWKKMTSWVYKGYKVTYKKLGVSFDKQYYESEIYKQGKEIVVDGLKKGIFREEDGAIVADLEAFHLPKKVLVKSDGTSLYMTQDIYLAFLKEKEFNIDASLYVVASEQDNHFMQLFKILELLDFKAAKKCYHLSYGMINLPTGRMKSREGNVVDADDIVDEVISLAKNEITSRYKDLAEKEVLSRANTIGLGALKFHILKFDNVTSFVYNPEESLSFEGETGPYCQYAFARICSLLKKADEEKLFDKFNERFFENKDNKNDKFNYAFAKKLLKSADLSLLKTEQEVALLNLLKDFPEVVEHASRNYKPSLVARYALDLAQKFNEFYHSCQILKEENELRNARILLAIAVKQVLENSLRLLNIDVCDEM